MSSDCFERWFFSGIVLFSKKNKPHISVFFRFFEDFYRDHLTPRSQLPLQVSFEESSAEPAKNLNVQSFEIQPAKELLGDPGETREKPGRIMIHGDWDLRI